MKEIEGKSVLILGYAREGRSTHRYLSAHYPGKKIGVADKQEIQKPLEPDVEIYSGENYLEGVANYDVIVRSPGVPLQLPELQEAIKLGKRVTSETNIFFSECPGTIIGVTGTKGKSTTASLISEILKERYEDVRLAGNIGRPSLDYLTGAGKETVFVIELSSQQLDDIRYSPHIAVILAIVPEHLDYHEQFREYVRAKSNIVKYQKSTDIVVFNPLHKLVADIASRAASKKFRFSIEVRSEANCFIDDSNVVLRESGGKVQLVMSVQNIPLIGRGNLENVLAAISVGTLMEVPIERIREAVTKFKPLEHRLEFVAERKGIKFYNDSLATIPEAAINALDALGENVETLIAGGFERGLDFSELGRFIAKSRVRTLILFPETGKKIWEAVCKAIPESERRPKMYQVSSMKEAVEIASAKTQPGKICLLSPASASFGLFRDYQDRGKQFKDLVLTLEK